MFYFSTSHLCFNLKRITTLKLKKSPLNFIADALWEDFIAGRPIDGGVAFEEQLRKCKLDGSLGSLQRLDKLLIYIRGQLRQPYELFMSDEKNRKLIWFIGFYVGNVLAKAWRSSPNWLGYNELNKRYQLLKTDEQNPFEFMALDYLPRSQHTTAEYKHLFFVLEPIGVRLFGDLNQSVTSVLGSAISPSVFDAVVKRLPPAIKQKIEAKRSKSSSSNQQAPAQTPIQDPISFAKFLSQSHLQNQLQNHSQLQSQEKLQSQSSSEPQTQSQSQLATHPQSQISSNSATGLEAGSMDGSKLLKTAKLDAITKHATNLSVTNSAAEKALLRSAQAKKQEVAEQSAKPPIRQDAYSNLRQDLIDIEPPLTHKNHGIQDYSKAIKVLDSFDNHIAKHQQAGKSIDSIKFPEAHLKARRQALVLLNRAAKAGNTSAMLRLAVHYFLGEGIAKDETKGFAWVQKAASDGDIRGQRQLSRLYYKGVGHDQSVDMGLYWLEKAAENGHAEAKALVEQWNMTKTVLDEHRFEQTSDRRYLIVISMVVFIAFIIAFLVRT